MKLEAVATVGTFPIELWRDPPLQPTAWDELRKNCAAIAAERNMVLTDKGVEQQYILYMRFADGPGGKPVAVECVAEQADVVKVRLQCWATAA